MLHFLLDIGDSILSKSFTLKNNFITQNAYLCIELNAHSLIQFLRSVRYLNANENASTVFLPRQLGSQACERTFRTARSMSTVFSSILNFGMLALLRRLHRLHVQAVLQADSGNSKIKFPRNEKNKAKDGSNKSCEGTSLNISDKEIADAVERALQKAKIAVTTLGMKELLVKHSKFEMSVLNQQEGVEEDDDNDSDDEEDSINPTDEESVLSAVIQEVCEEDPVHIDSDLKLLCEEGITDDCTMQKLHKYKRSIAPKKVSSSAVPLYYPHDNEKKPVGITPFVEVCVKGHTFMIRKTTAIWLFQESERVSADRLFRVRDNNLLLLQHQRHQIFPTTQWLKHYL